MTKLEKVIKRLEETKEQLIQEVDESQFVERAKFEIMRDNIIDALELLKAQQSMTGFEVLDEISSAYGGKQIFFLQDNGLIYDRYEAEYITLEEAVSRMAQRVGDDGGV